MNLGAKLKEIRISKKVTQSTLADFLNIKVNTYSQYENNIRKPNHIVLVMISEYFNTSLDYILGRTNENSHKENPSMFDDYLSTKKKYDSSLGGYTNAVNNRSNFSQREFLDLYYKLVSTHEELSVLISSLQDMIEIKSIEYVLSSIDE